MAYKPAKDYETIFHQMLEELRILKLHLGLITDTEIKTAEEA